MKRYATVMIALSLIVSACTQPTPAPAEEPPADEMENMEEPEHDMENMEDDMSDGEHGADMHDQDHGGQVGMAMNATNSGSDFHLELVTSTPGEYVLYLSDNNREPVSPDGYTGTLAIINPDGSEIESMEFSGMGDHLMAMGGPTDEDQLQVRIIIEGPDLAGELEMEFTVIAG